MSDNITQKLARFIAEALTIPNDVKHQASKTFLNFIGCTVGGAQHSAVNTASRALLPLSDSHAATVMGRGERADPLLASLLNGMSASVYSYDDTHAEAVVHPGVPVGCALLAFAEGRRVTGRDFLLAYALGCEIVCRLSKAVSVSPAISEPGWIQTGITGGIGAAAAVAKLLNLEAKSVATAMGIASCQSSGMRSLSRSMCFSLIAGQAAQTGLRASLMAEQGFTASDEVFEAPEGYLLMYSKVPHSAYLIDGLGVRYELLKNTFKPYPCGVVIHPAIDASLGLLDRGLVSQNIQSILVRLNPISVKLASLEQPQTVQECQMSIQHWVAATLIDGEAGLSQSGLMKLTDPCIVSLRSRVQVQGDASMSRDSAIIEAKLISGEVFTLHIDHCRGSESRPMTEADLSTKFRAQCSQTMSSTEIDRLIDLCERIESLDDVSVILQAAAGQKKEIGWFVS